ncbi:MAG: AAA family ATPase [Solobacterium sp.]|nr:AAA family ATPase [Solobacterium sp.]
MDTERFINYRDKVVANVGKVIIGKDTAVQMVLTAFICSGHVLIEDVPGTGKTMLLRAFAKTIGGDFKRIQFTPDLLPSDLTGIHWFNQKTSEFEFRAGPLFTNIILADEINRATPRTQASLLEAMEERQITVDGETRMLEEPFMVMATQNPLESYGTFPLPDAQMDRFFMRVSLGYMEWEQEKEVVVRPSTLDVVRSLTQAVTEEETQYVRTAYTGVTMSGDVLDYFMDLLEATRRGNRFVRGVSTRGAIALYKASQVTAAMNGRDYVVPEDIQAVAPYVLSHRISTGTQLSLHAAEEYLQKLMEGIQVPLEKL